MLCISPESFILLRVTVSVYCLWRRRSCGCQCRALVPRPQLGAAASREILRVAALPMTIDDSTWKRTIQRPALLCWRRHLILALSRALQLPVKSVASQFREGRVCGMQNIRRRRADPLTTAENAPVSNDVPGLLIDQEKLDQLLV